MRFLAVVAVLCLVPLIGAAQCPPSYGTNAYSVGIGQDVASLCDRALSRTVVYSTAPAPTITYSAAPVTQPSQQITTTTTYTADPPVLLPRQVFRTDYMSVADPRQLFGDGFYGGTRTFFRSGGYTNGYGSAQLPPTVQINNFHGHGGGHQGFGGQLPPQQLPVQINNFGGGGRRGFGGGGGGGGGGGFFQGLGGGLATVIGAVGQVANSPAGSFFLGAQAARGKFPFSK